MPSVLVVDDYLDTCELLVQLLEGSGYPAICFTSGASALASAAAERPLMIFLDVMMPDMDGFAVLEALRANPALRDLPVVMYSAIGDPATASRALLLGANAFVVKGRARYSELRSLVERLIGLPGKAGPPSGGAGNGAVEASS
jgi:CheY-like chemotaxis protein